MAWELDSERPIYAQLAEKIKMGIISGQYPAGSWLPSVRELAAEAAVNPNTMQKALTELERTGLIATRRTNGRTVTEDAALIGRLREETARELARSFLHKLGELGYDANSAAELVQGLQEREEGPGEKQTETGNESVKTDR